jgi:hypothetical protein
MMRLMKKKFNNNRDNIKFFFIIFFAFLAANYFYNNIISKSTASNIKFREVNVEINGEVSLELVCEGTNDPNPSSINRGIGERTKNSCIGKGNFSAIVPQQRFVETP